MIDVTNHNINLKELLIYSVISLILLLALQGNADISRPQYDSLNYIEYAVNLEETGYFGTDKKPGNQNMPLYPYFISKIMDVSSLVRSNLICLSDRATYLSCSLSGIKVIFFIQAAFMLIPMVSVWLISNILFSSRLVAWLSGFFCLASGRLINFSSLILTEAILIPLFSILLVTFLLSIITNKTAWRISSAITIGFLTLTRPEYIYLFYFFIALNALLWFINKQNGILKSLIILVIGFYMVVGPWIARNDSHFNSTNLTTSYASVTLVQRVSYNRMSWKEWGTAFIYWFPDMGDSIAKKLFPESNYIKLTYDSGSYYLDSERIVLENTDLNNDLSIKNLLKVEVFGNILKHSLVTIPLFWKGVFVGKYWGVLGLLCFLSLSIQRFKDKNIRTLLILGVPLWFMVFIHAFVSINITRYNIFLIPYLSIFLAIMFAFVINKISSIIKK